MDRSKLAARLLEAGVAFDREVDAAMIAVYAEALSGMEDAQIADAIRTAIRTLKFFPKPAELREFCGVGAASEKDRSLAAWLLACKASEGVGAYTSVECHDTTLAATIEAMGGWVAFCRIDEETKWIERRFRELYEHFARQRLPQIVTKFLGEHEATSGVVGYVAMIGAPAQPTGLVKRDGGA